MTARTSKSCNIITPGRVDPATPSRSVEREAVFGRVFQHAGGGERAQQAIERGGVRPGFPREVRRIARLRFEQVGDSERRSDVDRAGSEVPGRKLHQPQRRRRIGGGRLGRGLRHVADREPSRRF